MSTDASSPARSDDSLPGRCPACRARVRGDGSWCSLCHADLRTPRVEDVPQPAATPAPTALPGTVDAADPDDPGDPDDAGDPGDFGDPDDAGYSDAERVADQLLAQLEVVEAGTGLPPMLDAARGPFGKVLLVSSVGLAVAAALISLLALLGWLF